MSDKIQPTHLEREAYVYVRQSSMSQVRNHLESQGRQYGLAEKANVLGFRSVRVIDEDLGRSGTGSIERPGFGKLLAAVCSGVVGAVLALDASRLARNNRDEPVATTRVGIPPSQSATGSCPHSSSDRICSNGR